MFFSPIIAKLENKVGFVRFQCDAYRLMNMLYMIPYIWHQAATWGKYGKE